MREELYVIIESELLQVDLENPSGITLVFNSNLFNDLSKIDCSRSYTFSLPNTSNNDRIFDMMKDVRHSSSLYGKKVACRFILDGIEVVKNGNLYVSEIKDGRYNAVMTFGIISGLQDVNDSDISINELDQSAQAETTDYGWISANGRDRNRIYTYIDPSVYSNNEVQHPLFSAGVSFSFSGGKIGNEEQSFGQFLLPPPVVPLYKIIQKIASHYSLTFDSSFLRSYTYSDWQSDIALGKEGDMIQLGGIPLVSTVLGDQYEKQQGLAFNNVRGVDSETFVFTGRRGETVEVTIERVLQFASMAHFVAADFIDLYDPRINGFFKTLVNMVSLRIGGCLYIEIDATNELEEPPYLRIVQLGFRGEHELSKIDAEYDADNSSSGHQIYFWDFRETEGHNTYDVETMPSYGSPICFQISEEPAVFTQGSLEIRPHFDEGIFGHKVRVFENLPDISCMTLLKSIYFMMGGYPKVNADGSLGITYFTDLRNNLANGSVYDWSRLSLLGYGGDLGSIKFTNGNLAILNYYLMKNESLEAKETSKTDDVYSSPKFSIDCQNHTLEAAKTIFQFPFYGKYLLNGKHHSVPTGETIKYWSVENNFASASESKPAVGRFKIEDNRLKWDVWQISDASDQYEYLQDILDKPMVVKVNILVPLIDLVNLDYARPVYLDQLNSYFAIMSVEYSSAGTCTATLIRLPNFNS